jgi:quercetin dioxygenase-like cupin family protein
LLEGEVVVRVGSEGEVLGAGSAVLAPAGIDHAVENKGPARAAVLVFMAPKP